MAAATALATATAAAVFGFGEVLGLRHATEFEGHADILADRLLDGFQFALGVEEIGRDLILEQGIARGLELADLGGTQLHTGVLLVVKFFTALMDALILETGGIVIEEPLDLALEFLETWLTHDLGAEFLGLGDHRRVIC